MTTDELVKKLPKYKYDDEYERYWLTITTTISGGWNIGYANVEGTFIDLVVGDCKTLNQALSKFVELVL